MAKRRPRPVSYRRGEEKQLPDKRVLIVCEGEQTEKNYFHGLRRAYRLSTMTLEVVSSESGSNASNILLDADKRVERAKKDNEPFSNVYCVFDRDDERGANVSFQRTVDDIGRRKKFHAIYSIPSFEYWLLLHFVYTRQCFETPRHLMDRLLKEYPQYQKNQPRLFLELQDKLDQALSHADRCDKEVRECGEDNPSTQIHCLVRFLQELRDAK